MAPRLPDVLLKLSLHNTNSSYEELIFWIFAIFISPPPMWPHTSPHHTYSGHDMTLDQFFEGHRFGHNCHHCAHAIHLTMVMILVMLGDLDIVSKTSRCQSCVASCLPPIYPFHHRRSKIHPRKNHNYYILRLHVYCIYKREPNPVGFTYCSQFSPISHHQPKSERMDWKSFPLVKILCHHSIFQSTAFREKGKT